MKLALFTYGAYVSPRFNFCHLKSVRRLKRLKRLKADRSAARQQATWKEALPRHTKEGGAKKDRSCLQVEQHSAIAEQADKSNMSSLVYIFYGNHYHLLNPPARISAAPPSLDSPHVQLVFQYP